MEFGASEETRITNDSAGTSRFSTARDGRSQPDRLAETDHGSLPADRRPAVQAVIAQLTSVTQRDFGLATGRWALIGGFSLIVLLNGSSFPATKAGLAHLPPLLFASVRYTLGALLLLSYARLRIAYWRPHTRSDWYATLWGGVFMVGGIGLLFVGQQYTTSGVAAVLTCSTPILTVVLARVFLPAERLAPLGVVGIVLGFVGVSVVVGPDVTAVSGSGGLGPVTVLVATASYSLGVVLIRRTAPTMGAVPLAGWTMLVGAVLQFGFSLGMGESTSGLGLDPVFLLLLGYLVVFPGAVGFVVYLGLVSRIGPQRTSVGSYLTPVVALLGGVVFLAEAVPVTALVGFTIIAAGFGLLTFAELSARRNGRETVPHGST